MRTYSEIVEDMVFLIPQSWLDWRETEYVGYDAEKRMEIYKDGASYVGIYTKGEQA